MPVKFYRGPAVSADAEVPAADAVGLRTFTKAWLDDAGRVMKAEMHDGGAPISVTYYAASPDGHRREYPGLPYSVWSILAERPGYTWKYVRSYDSAGALRGVSKILTDAEGREVMQIDADANGRSPRTTKYDWDAEGRLRYVFEYGEDGRRYGVSDVEHGDHAAWSDITSDLDDVAFFETAAALPRGLPNDSIPADPKD